MSCQNEAERNRWLAGRAQLPQCMERLLGWMGDRPRNLVWAGMSHRRTMLPRKSSLDFEVVASEARQDARPVPASRMTPPGWQDSDQKESA